jgi:hypothetical protein
MKYSLREINSHVVDSKIRRNKLLHGKINSTQIRKNKFLFITYSRKINSTPP